MCLLSISNEFVASDNPLVKRPFYTFYLTEEETRGIDHLSNMTAGYVMTDYVTGRYITFSKFKEKSQILETNPNATLLLRNTTDDVFLIRKGELARRPLKISTAPSDDFLLDPQEYMLKYTYSDSSIWSLARRYSKIYDSKEIVALN
jgi:hypothetical protein